MKRLLRVVENKRQENIENESEYSRFERLQVLLIYFLCSKYADYYSLPVFFTQLSARNQSSVRLFDRKYVEPIYT